MAMILRDEQPHPCSKEGAPMSILLYVQACSVNHGLQVRACSTRQATFASSCIPVTKREPAHTCWQAPAAPQSQVKVALISPSSVRRGWALSSACQHVRTRLRTRAACVKDDAEHVAALAGRNGVLHLLGALAERVGRQARYESRARGPPRHHQQDAGHHQHLCSGGLWVPAAFYGGLRVAMNSVVYQLPQTKG